MCSLCAVMGGSTHWTDAAGRSEFERSGLKVTRRAEREWRVSLLNAVLSVRGVKVLDWGGNSYVLEGTTGKSRNAYTINAIWQAADDLITTPVDPLDQEFLDQLERSVRKDDLCLICRSSC